MEHRGGSNVAEGGVTVAETAEEAGATLVVAEVQAERGLPDPSAWNGPWIPGSDASVRFQVYGADAFLNTLSRAQYVVSRPLRRRLLAQSPP